MYGKKYSKYLFKIVFLKKLKLIYPSSKEKNMFFLNLLAPLPHQNLNDCSVPTQQKQSHKSNTIVKS